MGQTGTEEFATSTPIRLTIAREVIASQHHLATMKSPSETLVHYSTSTEGFQWAPQLVPPYAERREAHGRLMTKLAVSSAGCLHEKKRSFGDGSILRVTEKLQVHAEKRSFGAGSILRVTGKLQVHAEKHFRNRV